MLMSHLNLLQTCLCNLKESFPPTKPQHPHGPSEFGAISCPRPHSILKV